MLPLCISNDVKWENFVLSANWEEQVRLQNADFHVVNRCGYSRALMKYMESGSRFRVAISDYCTRYEPVSHNLFNTIPRNNTKTGPCLGSFCTFCLSLIVCLYPEFFILFHHSRPGGFWIFYSHSLLLQLHSPFSQVLGG